GDRGEHGRLVHGPVRGDTQHAGLVADLHVLHAGDLPDLLAHGHLAVAAGHAGHLELGGGRAHGSSPPSVEHLGSDTLAGYRVVSIYTPEGYRVQGVSGRVGCRMSPGRASMGP